MCVETNLQTTCHSTKFIAKRIPHFIVEEMEKLNKEEIIEILNMEVTANRARSDVLYCM